MKTYTSGLKQLKRLQIFEMEECLWIEWRANCHVVNGLFLFTKKP